MQQECRYFTGEGLHNHNTWVVLEAPDEVRGHPALGGGQLGEQPPDKLPTARTGQPRGQRAKQQRQHVEQLSCAQAGRAHVEAAESVRNVADDRVVEDQCAVLSGGSCGSVLQEQLRQLQAVIGSRRPA